MHRLAALFQIVRPGRAANRSPAARASDLAGQGDKKRDQGDWSSAEPLYRAALDLDATLTAIWVQYGHSLKVGGRTEKALDAYLVAFRLDPGAADTALQIGHATKLLGRRSEAFSWYARACELSPDLDDCKRELDALAPLAETPPTALRPVFPDARDGQAASAIVVLNDRSVLVDVTPAWLALSAGRQPTLRERVAADYAFDLARHLQARLAVCSEQGVERLSEASATSLARSLNDGGVPFSVSDLEAIDGASVFLADAGLWRAWDAGPPLRAARRDRDIVAVGLIPDISAIDRAVHNGSRSRRHRLADITLSTVALVVFDHRVVEDLPVDFNPGTVRMVELSLDGDRRPCRPGPSGAVVVVKSGDLEKVMRRRPEGMAVTLLQTTVDAGLASRLATSTGQVRVIPIDAAEVPALVRDATVLAVLDETADFFSLVALARQKARPVVTSVRLPAGRLWGNEIADFIDLSNHASIDRLWRVDCGATSLTTFDPQQLLAKGVVAELRRISRAAVDSSAAGLSVELGRMISFWPDQEHSPRRATHDGSAARVGNGWRGHSANGALAHGSDLLIAVRPLGSEGRELTALTLVYNETGRFLTLSSRSGRHEVADLDLAPGACQWMETPIQLDGDGMASLQYAVVPQNDGALTFMSFIVFAADDKSMRASFLSDMLADSAVPIRKFLQATDANKLDQMLRLQRSRVDAAR